MKVWFPALVLAWVVGCSSAASERTRRDAGPLPEGGTHKGSGEAGVAGGSGSFSPRDASVDADAQLGEGEHKPIDTPLDQWTFLPIDGMRCGNGQATGVGVQRSAHGSDLLLLMQGGGACWDYATCYLIKSAVNVETGVDAQRFASQFAASAGAAVRDPANPLSLATAVYVPYCTGDLHAGDAERTYTLGTDERVMHHVGARNLDRLLERLAGGLPKPDRIWVIGSSAGGYGATFNMQAIAKVFPDAELHVLSDCGPLLTPGAGRYGAWQQAWNMRLPAGCEECKQRPGAVIDVLAADQPGRIGLLAFARDATVGAFFGLTDQELEDELDLLLSKSYGYDNTRYFVLSGTDHVMIDRVGTLQAADGTKLSDWVAGWLLGLPSWKNVR